MAAGVGDYIIKPPQGGLLDSVMADLESDKTSEKLKKLSLS